MWFEALRMKEDDSSSFWEEDTVDLDLRFPMVFEKKIVKYGEDEEDEQVKVK